jgi:hypothetical protein
MAQSKALDVVHAFRQEAQDLMTTAVAVATARAQATADAANVSPSPAEPDIAAALTAVCQVATNALEVTFAISRLRLYPMSLPEHQAGF